MGKRRSYSNMINVLFCEVLRNPAMPQSDPCSNPPRSWAIPVHNSVTPASLKVNIFNMLDQDIEY